jgi:hypothetical protein
MPGSHEEPPALHAADVEAKQTWENEGGSAQSPIQVAAAPAPAPAASGAAAIQAVDARQDQFMIVNSSDGAPPPRLWRLAGWHWFVVLVPVLLILGGLTWIALTVGLGAALAGFVLLVVMGGAAAPVWGAGLLRGGEERLARENAVIDPEGQPQVRAGESLVHTRRRGCQ